VVRLLKDYGPIEDFDPIPEWDEMADAILAWHDAETRVLRAVLGRILDRMESHEVVGFSVDDYEMVRAVVRDAS